MKNSAILVVWIFMGIILVACLPSEAVPVRTQISLPTETRTPTSKSLITDTLIPTAIKLITPDITATPITAIVNSDDDMESLIRQIYPEFPCIGYNYAKESSEKPPPKLDFVEVDIQPDSKLHWISEIAENANNSRQAFVACEPELCQDKIYVKDFKSNKVFEINWE